MKPHPALVLCLLALASCAMTPPPEPPPVAAINVTLVDASRAEADAHALQYCAEYGAWTTLEKVNYSPRVATLSYTCD